MISIKQKEISYFLILFIFLMDQASKIWILGNLMPGQFIKITNFFNIVLVFNYGITFGMLKNYAIDNFLITIIALSVLIVFVLFLFFKTNDVKEKFSYALILGGAFGNLIDRIRLRAVVDFLDFYIGIFHWPAFNIADSAIVIGVGIMFVINFFKK